jgi:hypothetical protein
MPHKMVGSCFVKAELSAYSWSSVCQFAGTRPAGPGTG